MDDRLLSPGSPEQLVESAAAGFRARHGGAPTVVGRAPGRVNLIGEHTDYNAGLCLPVALPHATYAAARVRDDGRLAISTGQQEEVWSGTVAGLGPGAVDGWAAYAAGVIWAMNAAGLTVPGLDLHVESTVPLGAGLSSSAALECSVAAAACALTGRTLDDELRAQLVGVCMRAETEMAGAPTGGMDQSIALLAAPDHALLLDFDGAPATQVPIAPADAGLGLLVVDTRVSHALNDGGYGDRRADCERAAALLGVPSLRHAPAEAVEGLDEPFRSRAQHVVSEIDRVERAVAALEAADWSELGRLFEESHASLRDDFGVSCPELDAVTEAARAAGALGARMTGGGFGGSAVLLLPEDRVGAAIEAIDSRFAGDGYRPPAYLHVEPADGASVTRL